jgi:flagellar hook-length control protein FliK
VTSRLFVEKTETLELLKADLRGLERALEQAGFRSDPGSLSLNLRDNGQNGNQAFWNQQDGGRGRTPFGQEAAAANENEVSTVQINYATGNAAASGVDIRV